MKNILFIEDEKDFARIVSSYLKEKGFAVQHLSSGLKTLNYLQKKRFDLVILDLGLPEKDGLKICQEIRTKKRTPILILTARDEIEDKVNGFNLGADDYLVKPVSLKELLVRIKRLLRRDLSRGFRSSIFHFSKIKFDTVSGKLNFKNKSVNLSKKEKSVLEYLLLNKNQVLTRMEIMDHVWGKEIDPFSNTLNVIVGHLKKKLAQLTKKDFIHSVHGLGYKFEASK